MINIGVIGLGEIWHKRHKKALLNLKNKYRITSICDTNKELAEIEASEIGCSFTDDYHEVISDRRINAVSILTPPWVRVDIIKAATEAKKHIYCQKPLDINIENARMSAEYVRKSNAVFTTEFVRRHFPSTIQLKELLTGQLGKPVTIFCNSEKAPLTGSAGGWMQSYEKSGGYMMDYGIHLVDLCRYIFDSEVESLFAYSGKYIDIDSDIDDYETFMLRFTENQYAQIEIRRIIKPEWTQPEFVYKESPVPFTIACKNAVVYFDPENDSIVWYDSSGRHTFESSPQPKRDIGVKMYEMFYDSIKNDVHPSPDIEDALKAVEIILRREESKKKGVWIKV